MRTKLASYVKLGKKEKRKIQRRRRTLRARRLRR
jgi:hypothetical protein